MSLRLYRIKQYAATPKEQRAAFKMYDARVTDEGLHAALKTAKDKVDKKREAVGLV